MMSDMLSQEEINALLNGATESASANSDTNIKDEREEVFDDIEKDTLGEIGNISMGSAATTLFALLGHRVEITTPNVEQTTITEIAHSYPLPFISVFIKYSLGIEGMNLLILKEDDVKVITSLMLGGDGRTDIPDELTEMHLSAISEAMNQMMGAASTSLSEMMDKKIDITPPKVTRVNFRNDRLDPEILAPDEEIICTSFRMTVGDLIDSKIMQILPISFAKNLVNKMMGREEEIVESISESNQQASSVSNTVEPIFNQNSQAQQPPQAQQMQQMPPSNQYGQQAYVAPAPPMMQQPYPTMEQVRVQPAQFSSFDAQAMRDMQVPENIDLIKDVMLQITVELGKTIKPIDEILDFKPGSILELDKVVGESLDILANGKKIALGEVVVIDENYGIRITDIIKPEKRLQSL